MNSVYQIIELCGLKGETLKKAHTIIDQFAERGLRSLAVSRQVSKWSYINYLLLLKNIS